MPNHQQHLREVVRLVAANLQGGGIYLRDRGLLAMERQARDQRLGLWRDKAPVPPWEWRQECWKALESGNSTPIC